MAMCLPQQCAVVCAAHGEGGGGAAVAEGERRIVRTEGCNIGEGEGGSAAFGGEDNGLDALRAEAGQIGKDALQGRRLMGDIDVENIADLVQPDQLGVLEDVGLSPLVLVNGWLSLSPPLWETPRYSTALQTAQMRYSRLLSPSTGVQSLH